MKKVRIGIVGVGNIAINWAHYPQYKKVENCEITAICDIDAAKLKKVGDDLNIPEKNRFTDYNDLIKCADVDAVDICTWNSVHCEIATAAAKAGKGFSIEKPVGMNYREVKKLSEVVKENGVKTFVCLSWRYRTYVRYMKHLIDSGKIGNLYHVYVRCIKDSGLWEGRKREFRVASPKGLAIYSVAPTVLWALIGSLFKPNPFLVLTNAFLFCDAVTGIEQVADYAFFQPFPYCYNALPLCRNNCHSVGRKGAYFLPDTYFNRLVAFFALFKPVKAEGGFCCGGDVLVFMGDSSLKPCHILLIP